MTRFGSPVRLIREIDDEKRHITELRVEKWWKRGLAYVPAMMTLVAHASAFRLRRFHFPRRGIAWRKM